MTAAANSHGWIWIRFSARAGVLLVDAWQYEEEKEKSVIGRMFSLPFQQDDVIFPPSVLTFLPRVRSWRPTWRRPSRAGWHLDCPVLMLQRVDWILIDPQGTQANPARHQPPATRPLRGARIRRHGRPHQRWPWVRVASASRYAGVCLHQSPIDDSRDSSDASVEVRSSCAR